MSDIAVIGSLVEIAGFGLAGARTYPADGPDDCRVAWQALPGTVSIVVLTAAAAAALGPATTAPGTPLTVVLP